MRGARVVEMGQRASMESPFRKRDAARLGVRMGVRWADGGKGGWGSYVFRDPRRSEAKPAPIRPMAEEKLKAATSAAAVLEERPMEIA